MCRDMRWYYSTLYGRKPEPNLTGYSMELRVTDEQSAMHMSPAHNDMFMAAVGVLQYVVHYVTFTAAAEKYSNAMCIQFL